MEVYWVLLEPCNWITIPLLARVQSLNRDDIPVDACNSAADEQVRLIEIAERLTIGVTDRTRARGHESEWVGRATRFALQT